MEPLRGEADLTLDLSRALAVVRQIEDLPPAERRAHLEQACAGDEPLHRQVEGLLAGGPHPAAPGRERRGRFGRYTIEQFVGRGGMGEVYRAVQDETNRTVALKLLRDDLNSAAVLQRFRREASMLARLRHPGIVAVLDAGTVDDDGRREPYLAIEYVDGEPLLEAAAARALGLRERLRLLLQICDAIHHAHQHAVLHCDLKPANVLVVADDGRLHARVLDFGVAVSVLESPLPPDGSAFLGTLAYMSPEQTEGSVDVRSEVYSLGALGYQLLCGRVPLVLGDLSLMQAVQELQTREPVLLGAHDPRLRGDLEAVFRKALAKDPRRRYASVAELAADLRRHFELRPVEARRGERGYARYATLRWIRRHRLPAAGIALGLGLAGWGFTGTVRAAAIGANHRTLLASIARRFGPLVEGATGTQSERASLLAECERSLEEAEREAPDDPMLQSIEAGLLTMRGNLYYESGRLDDCRRCRGDALALLQKLANAAPGDRELLRELATAVVRCGDLDHEARRFDAAERTYRDAHARFLELWAAAPDARQGNDDLAWSFLRLAVLQQEQGNDRAAEPLLALGNAQVQRLAELFPDLPKTVALQLAFASHLAVARARAPATADEAIALQQRCLALAQKLHGMQPGDLGALVRLIAIHAGCAARLRERGDPAAAFALLEDAAAHAADLMQVGAESIDALAVVAGFRCEQARSALAVGRVDEALAALALACAATDRVCALQPRCRAAHDLRSAVAEAAMPALCELDRARADVGALGRSLAHGAARPDATRLERQLSLSFRAQTEPDDQTLAAEAPGPGCGTGPGCPLLRDLTAALLSKRRGTRDLRPWFERLAAAASNATDAIGAAVAARALRELGR